MWCFSISCMMKWNEQKSDKQRRIYRNPLVTDFSASSFLPAPHSFEWKESSLSLHIFLILTFFFVIKYITFSSISHIVVKQRQRDENEWASLPSDAYPPKQPRNSFPWMYARENLQLCRKQDEPGIIKRERSISQRKRLLKHVCTSAEMPTRMRLFTASFPSAFGG